MDEEGKLKGTADHPVVKEVQHDPNRWNSLGPEALASMIRSIADDSGLDKEIVYILLTQKWVYTYKTAQDAAGWSKSNGN